MSRVTNVMLATPLGLEYVRLADILSESLSDKGGLAKIDGALVGGSKCLECNVWIAAFNCLDGELFVDEVKKLAWPEPGYIQVFYMNQDDDIWKVVFSVQIITLSASKPFETAGQIN